MDWHRRLVVIVVALSTFGSLLALEPERVIGGPCEGCTDVFVGMPEALEAEALIAPAHEPGEPLVIEGVVRDDEGRRVSGVIVYAYHTDDSGIYPEGETRHGRLRAWIRTAEDGTYRFETIRPGAYPGGSVPEHVHMHVVEPGYGTYWIDSIHFTDDPLLDRDLISGADAPRGGSGVVAPSRDSSGIWHVRRDIVLGAGVPGYRR